MGLVTLKFNYRILRILDDGTTNLNSIPATSSATPIMEVGTQTGDPEIQLEDSEMLGDNGLLDRDCVKNRNTIPATSTSSTTPILVSYDNDNNTSDDDECSDEDDCLAESGGEEEVSSSEDDMMLGLTDLSDSSEDDETSNYLQQPTSPNLSQKTLPRPSKHSVSLKSGSLRTSTRIKRAKTIPIQEPSSPDSSSHSSDNSEQTSNVVNEPNKQSSYFQCKIRECSVTKPSEQDLFEHVRIDHIDRKHRCMAKRKLGRSIGSLAKNVSKSARKFHIPALLKTEQIEVEVKPEIDTSCIDSKGSLTSNNILFKCSGCGTSGTHHLGLGYRLVKTTLLVEVGTQTGDESSGFDAIVDPVITERDGSTNLNSIPATSTTPIIVSSDNDDDTSDDDECSDEDDCLGESGGEEEVSSSEDDMMLGLTDLSDSSEDDETNCLQQPTSPNLSQKTLPQTTKQSVSFKSGSFRTSTRAKTNPILGPSSSDSSSNSSDTREQTSKVPNGTIEQNPLYLNCKIRGCSVEKPSEQDLFEHVRINHPDRKYRCDVCPIAFKLKTHLDRHGMTHSGDKPFQCDECGKCFRWKNYFDIHCRTHLGDKRFECDECKKSFKLKRYLKNHKLTHNKQRMIACRLGKCGLRIPRENLEEHIKTVHPEYKHKCSSCPMAFKFNSTLIEHKRVHTGDKPFKCDECGRKFSKLTNLQAHQRIHTDERPFKCKVCGVAFKNLGNLTVHLRTHTGEKPFSLVSRGLILLLGRIPRVVFPNSMNNTSPPVTIRHNSSYLGGFPESCVPPEYIYKPPPEHSSRLINHFLPSGMAKRKLDRGTESSAKNISKSARKFQIPALLKTDQIEVEAKPEIDTPCTDSKSSITSNNILFTCSGCGTSGTHHLGLEYRLIKTAMLVEAGTQTGDESIDPEIQLEDSEMIRDDGLLDHDAIADSVITESDGTTKLNSIPASTTTASPIIVSSDNDDDTSDDDERSDEDDCLGESGGEEEISSSEDDMMLGLTDLSDSSEDDETSCLQQPTSPNLSLQTLPQRTKQPVSLNSGSRRASTRIKRAKKNPIQEPSSPVSPSNSSDNKENTFKVTNETNKQSSYFQCKIKGCSVEKPSKQDLFEHVRIDHSDRKYRCNVCPTAFKSNTLLTRHGSLHSEDKHYKCDECGKLFKWERSIEYHKLTHNKLYMISCRVGKCGLRIPREKLEEHIKVAHQEYEHKCSSCPMTFKSNFALIQHNRVHTGDKPYKCKECGKNFSRLDILKAHQRVHTGERPFNCKVCGSGFKQLGTLKAHMRTHSGKKPFSCNLCGKQFAQLNTFRSHELSCSGKL
eukprot:sb/3461065/